MWVRWTEKVTKTWKIVQVTDMDWDQSGAGISTSTVVHSRSVSSVGEGGEGGTDCSRTCKAIASIWRRVEQ